MQMTYIINGINLKGADAIANTTNFRIRRDNEYQKKEYMFYDELIICIPLFSSRLEEAGLTIS